MSETSQEKKRQLYWVTCAQLISMVLIVLSHAVPKNVDISAFIPSMTSYLQLAGLTVFIWTSGYLAVKTNQLEKYGYIGYIKKRVIRLLIPYIIFSLLMLVPKYVLSTYANSEVSLNPLIVLRQLITPREGIQPHLWFLPTLLILSLLLPFWKWCLSKIPVAITCVAVLLALQFAPGITNIACINDVIQYAIWFYLGIAVAEKMDSYKGINCVTLLLLIIAIGGWYLTTRLLGGGEQIAWLLYKLLCLSAIIAFSMLIQTPAQPVCKLFGKYSFPIYIMSLPVQNIVNILCLKAGFDWAIIWIAMFLMGFVIPYGATIIIELIERKSKHKVLSTIVGL
jgi:peptidoglycan/LPS O-acetylase OafA/YrhL